MPQQHLTAEARMTDQLPAPRTATGRSTVGTAALLFAAISAVALIVMIVLSIAGVDGFTSDNQSTAASDATWISFSLGALLALLLGIIAWVRGRRRGPAEDVKAGQTAVGYFVLAVLATAIATAVTDN